MSGDPSGSCSPKTFLLTYFVGGGGAAVVLAEEGVDQAQLREAVLAKAGMRTRENMERYKDNCVGLEKE